MNQPTRSQALEDLVEKAELLHHDVSLRTVKEWLDRNPGRKAIGHMPVWAPRELIHAAGALPVGVVGGGDDVEIIKGDACFQSYICHIPRSTVEMGLNHSLDCLEGMIFPSICDVIRNLSGIWQLLFPGKASWYLDMPQSFDDLGKDFFRRELERLRHEIGHRCGVRIDDASLNHSIALFDENRRLIDELHARRRETPWLLPTSEIYVIQKAGNLMPVEEHNAMISEYLELALASARPPLDNARVVLCGSFCEQPPLNLIKTLERSGCWVVDDDFLLGFRLIEGTIGSTTIDPLGAIADAFVDRTRGAAFLYRIENKGDDLIARARAAHAEGVVFCAASFCDPALLDQPMLVKAVEAAGLPWTAFKFAENTGQFQVIREQAGTFADSIKLWSAA